MPERVFGRSSAQMIRFGRANLPIRSATSAAHLLEQLVGGLGVALQGDEGADRLAGVLVVLADHRRLGDVVVGDDRRLDLGGREPVAGDVDDVVDPPDHPEVAVGVAAGGVADQVALDPEALEVGLDEALVLVVEAAQHARPRPLQDQQALAFGDRLAVGLADHLRPRPRGTASSPSPAWSAVIPGSGVIMIAPVSVCHQVSTIGQRSPPITLWYQSQALGLIGSPTEPSRRSEERSNLAGDLGAPLDEGADRGRRRVEDRRLVVLDQLPPDPLVGVVGGALPHHAGGAVGERAVDDVGVAGDPADVGRAPVDVRLGLQVEDVAVGRGDPGHVAAGGVQDPLRLRGRAGGVEDEERVLGLHRLGRALVGRPARRPRRRRRRGPRSSGTRSRCGGRRRSSPASRSRRGARRPPA